MADRIAEMDAALRQAWSDETSSLWTADNPARGQCGVTALVVQDVLGGSICRTEIDGQWHFYNVIDGRRHDYTACQFDRIVDYTDRPATRAEAFRDCTATQYEVLSRRVAAHRAHRP